jgi:hypothetical protein
MAYLCLLILLSFPGSSLSTFALAKYSSTSTFQWHIPLSMAGIITSHRHMPPVPSRYILPVSRRRMTTSDPG